MTLIGGLGTLSGPALGAFLIVVLESKLDELGTLLAHMTGWSSFTALGELVSMIMGLLFIVSVLAFRQGIMATIAGRGARLASRRRAPVMAGVRGRPTALKRAPRIATATTSALD